MTDEQFEELRDLLLELLGRTKRGKKVEKPKYTELDEDRAVMCVALKFQDMSSRNREVLMPPEIARNIDLIPFGVLPEEAIKCNEFAGSITATNEAMKRLIACGELIQVDKRTASEQYSFEWILLRIK